MCVHLKTREVSGWGKVRKGDGWEEEGQDSYPYLFK